MPVQFTALFVNIWPPLFEYAMPQPPSVTKLVPSIEAAASTSPAPRTSVEPPAPGRVPLPAPRFAIVDEACPLAGAIACGAFARASAASREFAPGCSSVWKRIT